MKDHPVSSSGKSFCMGGLGKVRSRVRLPGFHWQRGLRLTDGLGMQFYAWMTNQFAPRHVALPKGVPAQLCRLGKL